MKPITIIGGGLAGLTLGIALRKRQIPTTIVEAGHYPRHRVCGEFVNGRGNEVLDRLGLREVLIRRGARTAITGCFFSGVGPSPVRPLPQPALCLSRYAMDALLANAFLADGGILRANTRNEVSDCPDGTVRATGRRRQASENGWRWFGLKVHARNVPLAADLEMHILPNGYVGLCRLSENEVNVCGLFRRRTSTGESSRAWRDALRGPDGSELRQRLAGAEFDESSFCSVAGLSLRPQRAIDLPECCIGDALTMTPPVTGNGMSMAFESAEFAIGPLVAYSEGKLAWPDAREAVARTCDNAFARRLACGRALQWIMFSRLLQGWLGRVALHSDWLWQVLFANTR